MINDWGKMYLDLDTFLCEIVEEAGFDSAEWDTDDYDAGDMMQDVVQKLCQQKEELINACHDMRKMLLVSGVPESSLLFFDQIIQNAKTNKQEEE